MTGWLDKTDNGWGVKWSDLHSFAHGTYWEWTPLQSTEVIDETDLKDGDKVEFEFIIDDGSFTVSYVKLSKTGLK